MTKVFNYLLFWKKKSKSSVEKPRKNKTSIVYIEEGPNLQDVFYDHQSYKSPKYKSSSKRLSNNFVQSPVYSQRRCNPTSDRRVRSYPVSPERSILKKPVETDYFSDHYSASVLQDVPYRHVTPVIYTANIPQASSKFGSNRQEIKEPFPYKIPVSVPRRSSLFYGVKMQENMSESPQYIAEKPIEDSNLNFSTEQDSSSKMEKREKHVSIAIPDSGAESSSIGQNPITKVSKKTIVRFRPSSSSSCAPPSDSVKVMPLLKQPHPPLPGRNVHHLPLRPSKLSSDLITSDGRKLIPVKASEDKVRSSIAHANQRESQAASVPPIRQSFLAKDNGFPVSEEEPVMKTVHVVPARKSVRRSSDARPSPAARQSISHKESTGRRQSRISWEQLDELRDTEQNQTFPFRQEEAPVVYAVPLVPTRGRSKSILKQSMRTLTARNPADRPGVNRKNIRISTDMDMFAAEARRVSVAQDVPGFVNMEKGQAVLVSDVLNPISSLFISDLKDTVPKDPLTKPKESNMWVKPRPQRQSFQRTPVIKQRKATPKVQVVYHEPPKVRMVQRKHSKSYQRYYRDESSSSEDDFDPYPRKSQHGKRQYYQHAVYAAQMPDAFLPDVSAEIGKNLPFKRVEKPTETDPQPSTSKDYCGLTVDAEDLPALSNNLVKAVSSVEQTDVEDEADLVCYPSENFFKNATLKASEPGSKYRWRIKIKRGDGN